MIFGSTAGVSAEAERVIKCLNKAVAANSDIPEGIIATRFWQRIGVDLLRELVGHFTGALQERMQVR